MLCRGTDATTQWVGTVQTNLPAWQMTCIFSAVCASNKVYLVLQARMHSVVHEYRRQLQQPCLRSSHTHCSRDDDMLMFVYLVCVHMPAATCVRGRIEAAWKVYSERPNRSAVCDGKGLHLEDIWHDITFALHHLWYLKQAAAPRGGCEIRPAAACVCRFCSGLARESAGLDERYGLAPKPLCILQPQRTRTKALVNAYYCSHVFVIPALAKVDCKRQVTAGKASFDNPVQRRI